MLGKQVATTDMQAAGGGGGCKQPNDERMCADPDDSREPRSPLPVEGGVGGEDRRPARASKPRARHEKESSTTLGAYAYLAQPSPPKSDMEFRREESRTILIRLLARRAGSIATTASSVRKAA